MKPKLLLILPLLLLPSCAGSGLGQAVKVGVRFEDGMLWVGAGVDMEAFAAARAAAAAEAPTEN